MWYEIEEKTGSDTDRRTAWFQDDQYTVEMSNEEWIIIIIIII